MTARPTSLAYQPSNAELRMLGAILFQSIRDAWQRGVDRTRFRGYCIEARRIDAAGAGRPQLMLTLRVTGASLALDRLFIAVAPYPIPGAGFDIRLERVRNLSPRRTESPVGCVSPTDARYASPETGNSPENRRAARLGDLCQLLQPSRGVPSPHWGWSLHFYPCVPCP